MEQYYKAYDQRYKTIHQKGHSWAAETATPIVLNTLLKYGISKDAPILEIGCGEGRDARAVLEAGYCLTATDISPEAIRYCRETFPAFQQHFHVMDCLSSEDRNRYDFLYAVAVVHMLVLDEDRDGFYRFLRDHLKEQGLALVCSMGNLLWGGFVSAILLPRRHLRKASWKIFLRKYPPRGLPSDGRGSYNVKT